MLETTSRHFVVITVLVLAASGSSCDSPPENVQKTQAAIISQSCVLGSTPPGMFQADCAFTACWCFPRSPTNPEQVVYWSTTERMVDADNNGIIDLGPPGNPPAPGASASRTIRLNLNSCGSQRAPINSWLVTSASGFSSGPKNVGSACMATVDLPDRGAYHVQLTATYDNQTKVTAKDITVTN